eukprot:RCo041523
MAKDTAKRTHKRNQTRLAVFAGVTVALNVLFLAWRAWWYADTFTALHNLGWLALAGGEGYALYLLYTHALPSLDEQGKVEACEDLSELHGIPTYAQDVLWVSWFVQFTTAVVSEWFWLFYLVIPGYAGYQLWVNVAVPYIEMKKAMMASQAAGAGAPGRGG